jgi:YbbR domain-containing protein
VQVRLDLENAVAGANEFTITGSNISLPPGIVLKTVTPRQVAVTLDRLMKKKLPVQVDWTGSLDRNLIMTEVRVSPQFVEISGGGLLLKNIDTVYTQKLPLDNLEASGFLTVGLALEDPSLKVAPASREEVIVEYTLQKRP